MQEGARVYNPLVLKAYDLWVLGFSNTFVWKCPTSILLDVYRRNVSNNHLDIGVGTGWYLSHVDCAFQRLALMDLNPNSLAACSRRVHKYAPKPLIADALKPFPPLGEKFDSVAMMYLLHCLPGNMKDKTVAIQHASAVMNPNARLFGATICGADFEGNFPARKLMSVYNRKSIFSNSDDDNGALEAALKSSFHDVKLTIIGNVTIFEASGVRV